MPKTMMTIMMMMMMMMTDPFTTNLVVKGPVAKGAVVKGAHPVSITTTIMSSSVDHPDGIQLIRYLWTHQHGAQEM